MEPDLPVACVDPSATPAEEEGSRRRRRWRKEELAVLLSVVATVVVVVQRFLTENTLLLLPSQTMALEESVKATKLAVSKLQLMLTMAGQLSLAEDEAQQEPPVADVELEAKCVRHRKRAEARRWPRRASNSWFETFIGSDDENAWREKFRMTRSCFLGLLEVLGPEMQALEGDPRTKLAAALHRMASGASHEAVAEQFGLGSATTSVASFDEVCKALQASLSHLFDFPSSPAPLNLIIQQFAEMGLPNCCGVVGCTRFPVVPGPFNAAYYQPPPPHPGPCVAMQGVVDANGRFMDISVGWGGSLLPSQIFRGSRLFARVEECRELLQGRPIELLNGVAIPEYVIGDAAYPLLPWLLTPYVPPLTTPPQPQQQHLLFNSVHDHARACVSRSFQMLKSDWRLLSTGELGVEDVSGIVAAACILHNFLLNSGELLPAAQEPLDPPTQPQQQHDAYAVSLRDALASHLSAVARGLHIQR